MVAIEVQTEMLANVNYSLVTEKFNCGKKKRTHVSWSKQNAERTPWKIGCGSTLWTPKWKRQNILDNILDGLYPGQGDYGTSLI